MAYGNRDRVRKCLSVRPSFHFSALASSLLSLHTSLFFLFIHTFSVPLFLLPSFSYTPPSSFFSVPLLILLSLSPSIYPFTIPPSDSPFFSPSFLLPFFLLIPHFLPSAIPPVCHCRLFFLLFVFHTFISPFILPFPPQSFPPSLASGDRISHFTFFSLGSMCIYLLMFLFTTEYV